MFGIGMPEMILILAVALIVIGPKKLPDLAKSLGRAMGEFKKATSDLKQSMETDTGLSEVKETLDDINSDIKQSISFDNIEDYEPAAKSAESDTQKSTETGEFKERKSNPEAMDDLKNAFAEMNNADDVESSSGETDQTENDSAIETTEEGKTQDERG
ncbi:MAG TPA: twin-arginine translocase subunit TatB [Desulfobacteraceae bacterium]|nr:twin-arginine translocase subunit TatB [Desulfobacteraceae bacterium]